MSGKVSKSSRTRIVFGLFKFAINFVHDGLSVQRRGLQTFAGYSCKTVVDVVEVGEVEGHWSGEYPDTRFAGCRSVLTVKVVASSQRQPRLPAERNARQLDVVLRLSFHMRTIVT